MDIIQRQILIGRIKLSIGGNRRTEILLNKTETKNIEDIYKVFQNQEEKHKRILNDEKDVDKYRRQRMMIWCIRYY